MLFLFTQTWPGPPPGAAPDCGLLGKAVFGVEAEGAAWLGNGRPPWTAHRARAFVPVSTVPSRHITGWPCVVLTRATA